MPNELWQADITHWPLANGTEVEILDINLERNPRGGVGSGQRCSW
jgi:hypothetical protein